MVFEIDLLAFLLGLLSRAGVNFTGFIAVYTMLWGHTLSGTMFADRSHFLMKLEVVIFAYASARMFRESGLDLSGWSWYLRPHHVSPDFAGLLAKIIAGYSAKCVL